MTGRHGPLVFVSAAMLLLELYWVRGFAESEWGHLASMVVSTAMLGIGAGGTLVLLLGTAAVRASDRLRTVLLAIFLLLAGITPLLVRRIPLEPLLLAWQLRAWGWVLVRELVVALPFAIASAVVALAFRIDRRPGLVYAANLFGSTAGVAAAIFLMALRPTADLHRAALVAGMLAVVTAVESKAKRIAAVVVGIGWIVIVSGWSEPILAPTKDLAGALRLPDARILADRPGTPGRWTMVESPALRSVSGLTLLLAEPLPPTREIFVRGDGAGSVLSSRHLKALRHRIAWLPYALREPASVVVSGEAALLEIQTAIHAGIPRIAAVIPDARTRDALSGELGRFSGIRPDRVVLQPGSDRSVLARLAKQPVDLLVIPADGSLSAASAGLTAAREDYLLTVEGITSALASTKETGQIAIQRWTQAPSRDVPKLVATVARALRRVGIRDPREHLVLVQGWDASMLCASRAAYGAGERLAVRTFAREHGFDVLLPVNGEERPFHELPGPPLRPLLETIIREGGPPSDYLFALEPATDDRPYFHHFLSYTRLPSYLGMIRDGTLPPADWGDLFLWAGLFSAILLGAGAIATPPLVVSGPRHELRGALRGTILFGCLGFGYMFLEILFLHQGTRLLGLASQSAAVTILAFLLGSGIGAALLSRFGEAGPAGARAAAIAAAGAAATSLFLGPLIEAVTSFPGWLAWPLFFIPALALAVPLGMPFPAGVAAAKPERIPWLVAVNGWASVVGAVIASLLAITAGFRVLGFAAAGLYALAAILLHQTRRP